MHILGFEWLNFSITTLTVLYCFVCVAMIFLILLQRPKQEGLGAAFGANTAGEIFGSRVTSVLQRGTVYLASLFFVMTLVLAILVQKKNTTAGKINLAAEATKAVVEAPAATEGLPASLQSELPIDASAAGATVTTEPVVVPDAVVTPPIADPTVTPEAAPVVPPTPATQGEASPPVEDK
jgi:preprotein translocase subunit SecG